MDRTSCDVLWEKVPIVATIDTTVGGYYQYECCRYEQLYQAAAVTSSLTSACERGLRSAVLRGGYDNDSILRLTRDD